MTTEQLASCETSSVQECFCWDILSHVFCASQGMAAGLGATLTEHGFDQNVALKKNMVHVNFSGTKIVISAK